MSAVSLPARGAFVVLVGPDGVGKTTVARALCSASSRPAAYFHFRPPVRRPMDHAPPDWSVPPPDKGSPNGSRFLGWARLGRNYLWFWLAYLKTVAPALRRGWLVVGDRWSYGYLAQPLPLKYYGPKWLATAAVRLLPQPDLVANLTAPAPVIHGRKQELGPAHIESELVAWAGLPHPRVLSFRATGSPEEVASEILGKLG